MPLSAGDVWRPYVKKGGILVFRKRTSIQTSPYVDASKQRIANKKPAQMAYERCIRDGKGIDKVVWNKDEHKYEIKKVCPLEVFRVYLREVMEEIHREAGASMKRDLLEKLRFSK